MEKYPCTGDGGSPRRPRRCWWRRSSYGEVSSLLHQVASTDYDRDQQPDQRYKNHDNARRVEFPLLTSVHHKRNLLQVTVGINIATIVTVFTVIGHTHLMITFQKASLLGDMGNSVLKKGNTVDTQVMMMMMQLQIYIFPKIS